MKKTVKTIVSLIMIVFMTNNPINAQQLFSGTERPVYVGVKGGLNQFTLQGSASEDIGERSGFQFGIFLTTGILDEWTANSENFKLRVGINYQKKSNDIFDNGINRVVYDGVELFTDEEQHGFEFDRNTGGPVTDDEIFDENVSSSVTYHFMETPVRFMYEYPLGLITPYILAGPTLSIVVDYDHSFTLVTEDGVHHKQTSISEVVDQHYSKLDLSANIGLGVHLPYGLFVEGYYSHGFINAMKFYGNNVFHRGFVANFGIQF